VQLGFNGIKKDTDDANALASIISADLPELRELRFCANQLGEAAIRLVADAIVKNTALRELVMWKVRLKSCGCLSVPQCSRGGGAEWGCSS
jgi:hypothetical protein